MIKLQNVSLQLGTKFLLDQASLEVYPQHKVAIIGPNGCGKTSLFGLLTGKLQADAGEWQMPKDWRIVSVEQQILDTQRTAIDYVIDGDRHLRSLEARLAEAEKEEDGNKLGLLHDALEQAGAYDVKPRAATILNGLGFTQDKHTELVSSFSGGWQMRLNLARALLCPSDLLLLDEPTNHLDLDAVLWLENWLQDYAGTLLLISHDQAFIDSIAKQIVSFEQQKLISYSGGYSDYEKQKAMRLSLAASEFEKQQKKRAHLESFINRFKAKASKAKQAQSRVKQLEKMQELMPVRQSNPFNFEFFEPEKLPNPLVVMDDIKVGYGELVILADVKLNLVPGSRIGLLGRNGAGKSTFIKLLAEELAPLSGKYLPSAGLKIGYFAQHQVDSLDMQASPLLHLQRLDKGATEQTLRNYLGGFGFHGDNALDPVAPMSGGEKARLVLAILVYQKPNLLLLDEPTNHLDIEVRQALNFALQTYQGAIVLVSHDRSLLESVCDDFYLVDSAQVAPFSGNLDDYKKWMLQGAKKLSGQSSQSNVDNNNAGQSSQLPVDNANSSETAADRKLQKRLEAEFRQAIKPLKIKLSASEQKMADLNKGLSDCETKMSNPEIYNDENKAELKQLLQTQGDLKSELEEVEMEWMEVVEQIEAKEQAFNQSLNKQIGNS
ncbi:ATP-binding cassette domain-containing protein [Glaciecola sp. 1036]|uniref:ATP-binding cassette domain-containing protein n=1 Tax=Alteromonadaceae TaxID=72275 RepID=UPI003D090FC1